MQTRPTEFLQPTPGGTAFHSPGLPSRLSCTGPDVIAAPPGAHHPDADSLCPSDRFIRTLPRGYYPPTLRCARCRCTFCRFNDALTCVHVHSSVTVLRPRGCRRGLQLFEEQVVSVVTSCACALRAALTRPERRLVAGGEGGGGADGASSSSSSAAAAAASDASDTAVYWGNAV